MSVGAVLPAGLCALFEATRPELLSVFGDPSRHQQGFWVESDLIFSQPSKSLQIGNTPRIFTTESGFHGRGSKEFTKLASPGLHKCLQGAQQSSSNHLEADMTPTSRPGGQNPLGAFSPFPNPNVKSSRGTLEAGGHSTSKPPSPVSQQNPEVILTEAEHDSDNEEGDSCSTQSLSDDNVGGLEGSLSAAERLAEKRRMKRFRLNHVQTRYLMNEFARHPHPDAAQRERLSREIPGLKPRQVQVWFQNRRAKMKRLTTDDQERMMRSRALPEDFDLSQTLHPDTRRPSLGHVPSLSNLNLSETANRRPTLRLNQDYSNVPAGSMSSVYSSYSPITGSATGSRNLSPVSPYHGSQYPENLSPVNATSQFNQLSRSSSFSTGSQALQPQAEPTATGNMNRRRAEKFATSEQQYPLSTSLSRPYDDQDLWSHQRAPLQLSDTYRPAPLQHSNTFPAGLNALPSHQNTSSLTSSSSYLYDPMQIAYPPATGNPGYYSASYTQNYQVSGSWQAPFPATALGGQSQPQASQYSSDADFSSDPSLYNQMVHGSSHISPSAQYTLDQSAQPSQHSYPAPPGQAPGSNVSRRRDRSNTNPGHYSNPQ